MRRLRQYAPLLGAVAILLLACSSHAQGGDAGTVIGHVYCADTQKPARFANIRLESMDSQSGRFGGGFAITGADGAFRIAGVAPGDYYADVMMPGYIQPLRGMLNDMATLPQADRDRITAQLTHVSVSANQTANVQVMIYRGGTINGAVSFDDGGPAAGVAVQALVLPAAAAGTQTIANTQQATFAAFTRTDDRGQFRLTGLTDGTYIVLASLRSIFPIYYGNTIERSHAKRLDLHAGDEATGADIQIPVVGMHRVSGVVTSQQDGHPLARASVQLRLSAGDNGTISAMTASDGSFTFNAVPDGQFTVLVLNAYDPTTHAGYASTGQAVEVSGTDVTDVVVNAAPRKE